MTKRILAALLALTLSSPAPAQGVDPVARGLAAAGYARATSLPPSQLGARTLAAVGDSWTDHDNPKVWTGSAITTTVAGSTSIVFSAASNTSYFAVGDIIRLCNSNCTTSETVTVASGWAGPGNTAIPIVGAVANSGETIAELYTSRMPYSGGQALFAWIDLAQGRLGYPLQIAQGPGTATSGYPSWATPQPAIYGESGATSSQILGLSPWTDLMGQTTTQNWLSYAIASGAQYIHVLFGANDIAAGLPASTTIANVNSAISQILAAGRVPIVGTVSPRSDPLTSGLCNSTTISNGSYAAQAQVNAYIRGLRANSKIIVVDYNRALADPANPVQWASAGANGNASVGGKYGIPTGVSYTPDCIHPSTWAGAWQVSSALADALQSSGLGPITKSNGVTINLSSAMNFAASNDPTKDVDVNYSSTFGSNPRGNIILNGGMSNALASCTAPGGAAGSCADGWSASNSRTPASGSITWSVVVRGNAANNIYDRGYWQQVVISQGAGTDWGSIQLQRQDAASAAGQGQSSSTWQIGDKIYAQMTFRVTDGCSNSGTTWSTFPTLQLNFYNGSTVIGTSQALQTGNPDSPTDPNSCPAFLVVRTPTVQIPPNTTRIFTTAKVQGVGTVQFSDVETRKVF